MKKINLVLKKKDSGYYFSNPATDSENEIFYTKKRGVQILMCYVADQLISSCRALELIDEITSIIDLPITEKVKSFQLAEGMTSLTMIALIKKQLHEFSVIESEKDLPKLKMCDCGKHGQIIGEGFISVELSDKVSAKEAVEELFVHGRVNKEERGKLLLQIEDLIQCEKKEVIDPKMN